MREQYQVIGEAAGKIYRALEKKSSISDASLKKEIGVSEDALFHQALGWLARENKISFEKKGKALQISLCQETSCCQQ